MNKFYHPYHLVSYSPWPIMLSLSVMIFMLGMLKWFQSLGMFLMLYGLMLMLIILFQWWRDVIREGSFLGFHTKFVIIGMKFGMMLFILSEVMFFVSFFWSYFHAFLSPNLELGFNWSPKMILSFDPLGVPLLNTVLLVISGVFITWSHMCLNMGNKIKSFILLVLTIIWGLMFSIFQFKEYNESFFSINDSVFGSIFFLLTGFHGIHVIIGTIFMIINSFRMFKSEFTFNRHIGFEFSAWYWHFVDLVWLFLYLILYCST